MDLCDADQFIAARMTEVAGSIKCDMRVMQSFVCDFGHALTQGRRSLREAHDAFLGSVISAKALCRQKIHDGLCFGGDGPVVTRIEFLIKNSQETIGFI